MQETQEMQIRSLDWEDTLNRKLQPISVFLPGKFHGQRSLVGYSPWGCKESDMTEHACKTAQNIEKKYIEKNGGLLSFSNLNDHSNCLRNCFKSTVSQPSYLDCIDDSVL